MADRECDRDRKETVRLLSILLSEKRLSETNRCVLLFFSVLRQQSVSF